jgi:hypothetical protein
VDAIHRADVHAGCVFCSDARLGNHVRHFEFSSNERF